jgi:acetyl-CoA carboxylase carboxyl transferase subunit alpha
MSVSTFEFEKPITDIEQEIVKLRDTEEPEPGLQDKLEALEKRLSEIRRDIYGNLTAWQRVQIARHLQRPHTLDYVTSIFTEWTELHGDRHFRDDHACVTGFGLFNEQPVAVIGQQKGRDVKDNVYRNFAQMHPEGYWKALRVMRLAEKFRRPIIVFIDTQGAYPGVGAEERGQAVAIARNIMEMSVIRVPIICTIIGEGGSGGALGIGYGDRILMMENAYYSVITPEGCASILWRDAKFANQAAECLKMTASDLLNLGIIDGIVPEPLGGAHRGPVEAADNVRSFIERNLNEVKKIDTETMIQDRFDKFRRIGIFHESNA